MRKLFVNLCRVKPQTCLELILAAFSELPQPLSQGMKHFNFPHITLGRLIHVMSVHLVWVHELSHLRVLQLMSCCCIKIRLAHIIYYFFFSLH